MIPDGEGIRFGEFAAGIRCRIQSGGTERVLWIHGYTLDSTLWDEIWSLLPNWTHYGIDLPGHGRSPALSPGARLRDLGERLSAAACARDIRHLVGLSCESALKGPLSKPNPTI
jgi:pimeloyl-ACP methyl ester carboxylesterase